jgi:transcriptional regulator
MYIPPYFRNKNTAELLSFMKAHPFAVLCSNGETVPTVTHLPFVFREDGDKFFLVSHFAFANPHAKQLQDGSDALVIFTGPHAYISPSFYEKQENVPTWNYIAVHASGKFHRKETDAEKETILKATIGSFEPGYITQYEQLSPQYLSGMLKGIVAFEIEVTQLEGKFKLSQNKTAAEREKIAAAHDTLAPYMKK